ncbi:MAG: VanZ family protein [Armatimonadetes bacterium]|nr:VanZ family protein [Armatimonadota bacterium]
MLRWLLWATVVAYMVGIWCLSAMGSQVTQPADATGISDFWLHLILYGGLGFLMRLAMAVTWPERQSWLLGSAAIGLTFLYGLTDEFHQSFTPGRGTDPEDIIGNLAGATVGQLGAVVLLAVCSGLMRRCSDRTRVMTEPPV